MGNRKTLGRLITKYALFELAYTFFILILSYLCLNIMIGCGVLYPANYAENHLGQIKDNFESANWSVDKIPYYYDFTYTVDGVLVHSTIKGQNTSLVKRAIENGTAISNDAIGARVFKYFKHGDRELVISYRLMLMPTSQIVYRAIDNFEHFYLMITLVVWSIGFMALIKRSTKLIKLELQKISSTNSHIQQMALDYPRMTSSYAEIGDVLNSLDTLATNLKASLKEQWRMQEQQRDMIESVTHDIRIPITLIKGNLELLKEEQPSTFFDRIQDIEKGVLRLEVYIQKLRNHSILASSHKRQVNDDTVLYWLDMVSAICKSNQRVLDVLQRDSSSVLLDGEAIAIALQNLVVNAIENSEPNTKIYLSFIDGDSHYAIIVKDQGVGFDEEILPNALDKYVTNKRQNGTIRGVGLHIVKNIIQNNNGECKIENYKDSNESGARVSMIFKN